jgi:hypothetical protein
VAPTGSHAPHPPPILPAPGPHPARGNVWQRAVVDARGFRHRRSVPGVHLSAESRAGDEIDDLVGEHTGGTFNIRARDRAGICVSVRGEATGLRAGYAVADSW